MIGLFFEKSGHMTRPFFARRSVGGEFRGGGRGRRPERPVVPEAGLGAGL